MSTANLLRLVLEGFDRERDSPLGSLDEQTVAAMTTVAENNVRLLRSNKPGRFRGDVVHFTAIRGRRAADPGAWSRWQPFVHGRVEDKPIDCRHEQMTHADAMTRIGRVIAGRLTSVNTQHQAGERP